MHMRAVPAETQVFSGDASPLWLSGAVAVITTLASSFTLWVPGILKGPDAMNGSARGTALVLLIVAVPLMTSAMGLAARGSSRAVMVWIGGLAYITYNSFLFLFETPFNSLFLLYVGMLGLSVAGLVCLLLSVEPSRIRSRDLPARGLAVYIWIVVLLNAAAWLTVIIPATFTNDSSDLLRGTGLATNAIYVQDLALWLPAMALTAFWLWHRRPWGVLLAGAGLLFWVVEALGIAVDQWFGARADPSSDVASMSAVPAFVLFAAVGLIPALFHFQSVGSEHDTREGQHS